MVHVVYVSVCTSIWTGFGMDSLNDARSVREYL